MDNQKAGKEAHRATLVSSSIILNLLSLNSMLTDTYSYHENVTFLIPNACLEQSDQESNPSESECIKYSSLFFHSGLRMRSVR